MYTCLFLGLKVRDEDRLVLYNDATKHGFLFLGLKVRDEDRLFLYTMSQNMVLVSKIMRTAASAYRIASGSKGFHRNEHKIALC